MKKYFLLLVVLSFVFGMSGSTFAQSLVSVDLWANNDHLLTEEDDVDNLFVIFEAHNAAEGVVWWDFAWDVPGTVYHNYIPADDLLLANHWHVIIANDPVLFWLGLGGNRDNGPHPLQTHYIQWDVADAR